jgi:hypothetical protein
MRDPGQLRVADRYGFGRVERLLARLRDHHRNRLADVRALSAGSSW